MIDEVIHVVWPFPLIASKQPILVSAPFNHQSYSLYAPLPADRMAKLSLYMPAIGAVNLEVPVLYALELVPKVFMSFLKGITLPLG